MAFIKMKYIYGGKNMGLFDKVFGGSQPTKLTAQESFIGVAMTAIAADGSITPEEAQGVSAALFRMKMFKGMSERQMKEMFDRVIGVMKKQGAGAIIASAAETLNPEMKETAFAIAADLALADGTIEDEEKKYLEELQKALGVKDDLALKIAEVLVIKNRG
jgi:tellurite resistance protein